MMYEPAANVSPRTGSAQARNIMFNAAASGAAIDEAVRWMLTTLTERTGLFRTSSLLIIILIFWPNQAYISQGANRRPRWPKTFEVFDGFEPAGTGSRRS